MDARINNVDRCQFELSDQFQKVIQPVKTSRIYLAAFAANLSAIAIGICMSWSSPMGPKLKSRDTDSPLSRPISTNEDAWISSIMAIGALIMPFIAGPLANSIGRKKVLLSSSLFFILGFVCMLQAKRVWILLIGRLIKGFGIGVVMCVSPMYVGEISNDKTRGVTGSFMSLLLAFGIYYVLCIGPYFSYTQVQYLCLIVPIIFVAVFICMPESPFYYVAKGRRSAASKSLQFLRGQSSEAVEAELVSIENMIEASKAQKASIFDIVKSAGNRKALLISMGLIFFQQVSGINAVLFNTQTIFESAHLNFSAAFASIVIGTVQVLAAALTPVVFKVLGRKTILLLSAAFMSIGLAALGYFFFAQNVLGHTTGISWLPVTALVVYMVFFTVGFGPVPWTVLSEIFPPNVKSLASAMTASGCWAFGFLVTLFYPALAVWGVHYAFWMFAAFSAAAFFFVMLVVLETKDLSLEEIQKRLNDKNM